MFTMQEWGKGKEKITTNDYHKEFNKSGDTEINKDKDLFHIKGYGVANVRTPQDRVLDWIVSNLIHKKTIITLIKL